MAAKKVGTLIKEARTNAGLSQEALAKTIPGLSAADISKAERDEKDLTQDQLKAIAKATGVTQKSLLEAAAGKKPASTASKTTASKTTASKTTASKTTASKTTSTASKTTASKTTASKTTASKTPAGATTSMKVTSTEKKLVELYREATSDNKKKAISVLKGEHVDGLELIGNLIEGTVGQIFKK